MQYTEEEPLYVIALGATTNVSSALLINPQIRDRIVIIWLGGCAYHWPHNRAFNLFQDIAGGRILFGCGAALVQIPGPGVASIFTTSGPELEYWLRGKNQLCNYLIERTKEYPYHGFSMMSCGHIAEMNTAAIYIVGAQELGYARGMGLKTRATIEEAMEDAKKKFVGPNPNILALPKTFKIGAVHLCMKMN